MNPKYEWFTLESFLVYSRPSCRYGEIASCDNEMKNIREQRVVVVLDVYQTIIYIRAEFSVNTSLGYKLINARNLIPSRYS
jgi:hypothetical protein